MKNRKIKFILAVPVILLLAFSITDLGRSCWVSAMKFAGIYGVPAAVDEYELNLHFMDVGKADSALLEHNGEYVLIDGGSYDKYDVISSYLKKCGVVDLDAVVISHFDSDHIGALALLMDSYDVSAVYMVNYPDELIPSSDEYQLLCSEIEEKQPKINYVSAGDEFSAANVDFNVLSPSVSYDNSNDMSLVVRAELNDFSALFTGDAGKDCENRMLDEARKLDSDILKVAHHGSNDSSYHDFLRAVSPEYSIVSCADGVDNLPGFKALSRLENSATTLLRTDKCGTIVISTNCDGKYTVSTDR